MIRTYLDTGVLIAAWRGTEEVANKAMAVLDDMKREFIFSEVLRLEIMPKTLCNYSGVISINSGHRPS